MLSLPIEIIYSIIEHLHTDTKALKACSLVSQSWSPAARSLLFSTPVKLHAYNAQSFIALLDSTPHLTLAQHLSSLILDGQDKNFRWLESLSIHLNKLTSVQSLRLEHIEWSDSLLQQLMPPLANMPLKQLTISASDFPSFDWILQLLCMSPSLQAFTVINISTQHHPDSSVERAKLAHDLRSLSVDLDSSPGDSHILQWLLGHAPVPLTQNLILRIFRQSSLACVADYIRILSSSLSSLELRFPEDQTVDTAADLLSRLDLTENPNLRSLTLSGGADFKGKVFNAEVFERLFSQISSASFKELVIIADELTFKVEERLIDFSLTTTCFSRSTSTSQVIGIRLYGFSAEEALSIQDSVKRCLPDDMCLHLTPPVVHKTFFERMALSGPQSEDVSIRYVQILE